MNKLVLCLFLVSLINFSLEIKLWKSPRDCAHGYHCAISSSLKYTLRYAGKTIFFCKQNRILESQETELIQDMSEESQIYSSYSMIIAGLFGFVVGFAMIRLMNMREMAKPERYCEMNGLVAMKN